MIRHIVMWKFKDTALGNTKNENMQKAKKMLLSLPPVISQIKSMTVGEDILKTEASFDFALAVDCKNTDDLNGYIFHPEHQKVGAFLKEVTEKRICADIEY